jgi:hypothetical protein
MKILGLILVIVGLLTANLPLILIGFAVELAGC